MSQMINEKDLPKIDSEFIEPYLKRWLMMELESLHYGFITPEEVKESLKWMDRFASRFCGIHAVYAAMNECNKINRLSNEQLTSIANSVFSQHSITTTQ